jgi:integrase
VRDYRINDRKSLPDAKARWNLHLKPFFQDYRAMDVSSALVARYVDSRLQDAAKPATVNRELAALKRMFRLGYYATPPIVRHLPAFPRLREDNTRKGFLEDAQYDKLAAECSKVGLWLRALLEVGCAFGWRVSELLGLRVQQVNLQTRTIRLEPGTTKNSEGRTAVMPTLVYSLVAQCIHGKEPDDYIFTREDGKPVRDFRDSWAKTCKAAGVPGLLFHDLRRTAVRNMTRRGIPERVAMQISGHKTRSIFDRYRIVSERDLRDAAYRMEHPMPEFGHDFGHDRDSAHAESEKDTVN